MKLTWETVKQKGEIVELTTKKRETDKGTRETIQIASKNNWKTM